METPGKEIAGLRKEYASGELEEDKVAGNPIDQFGLWLSEAIAAEVNEPTAMSLASCDDAGRPTIRVVLLKEYTHVGFTFFTNYESRKGRQLASHPAACLNFFWPELERQVRIEGTTEKVPAAESDAYFASRPRGSKIGAWASPQSRTITSRSTLDEAVARIDAQYPGEEIPRPPHWGGYILKPNLVEFWQGRPSRLHDRIQYTLEKGVWTRVRIAP